MASSSQAPIAVDQKFRQIRTELLQQLAIRPARTREQLLPYIDLYGALIESTPMDEDDREFQAKVFATLCRVVSGRHSGESKVEGVPPPQQSTTSTHESSSSSSLSWLKGLAPLVKKKNNKEIALEKKSDAKENTANGGQ